MIQLRFPPEVKDALEQVRETLELASIQDVLRHLIGMSPGQTSYTDEEVATIRDRVMECLAGAEQRKA
jgi:molybdopterin converting factor small subunit